MNNIEKIVDEIVSWMQDIVEGAHSKGLVFGLSGGIDSAVIAALSKRAFPNNSLGIIMPIHSNPKDEEDALLVSENTGIEVTKVDLSSVYDEMLKQSFTSDNNMAKSNIKPRLRMTTLYYYGQDRGYLVCGSSNKSEYYIGYFTKFGDNAADLFPLINFTKDEIFEIAKHLKLPSEIIEKKPSAGLWEGQTDEGEMGFSYDVLNAKIKGLEVEEALSKRIEKVHKTSEHKRILPNMFPYNK